MRKSSKLLLIIAAAALGASTVALVGCTGGGEETEAPKERSELVGGFESTESRDIVLTNDSSLIGMENEHNIPYVYTSDIYPLNTIEKEGLKYNTYQKLRLKRDFTYEYNLEILVRMVTVQSNIDLLKLEATTFGTFEYKDNANDNYTVTLSSPTSGVENRYGSFIIGDGNIFSWKLSTSPNYSLNVENVLESEEPEFDRYIATKTVAVEKYETERILYNTVFYTDFVQDMAEYCSYDSSAVAGGEEAPSTPQPVEPDDDPVFTPDLTDTTVLPYSTPADGISFAVSVGGETQVLVKAPNTVDSVGFGSTTVSQYETDGDSRIFAHTVALSDLDKAIAVTVGATQNSFTPTDYLNAIVIGTETDPRSETAKYLAANLVNACGVYNGSTVSDAIKPYVFDAAESYWGGGNWGRRDNVDNLGGNNEAGFEWVNPVDPTSGGLKIPYLTIGADVGELTYAFAVDGTKFSDLRVSVAIGDDNINVIVPERAEEQPLENKTVYTFKVRTASPLGYDDVIKVAVINGQKQISHTSGYSVTRALTKIIGHNEVEAIDKARALWSLGKAATAYGYIDKIQVYEKAPINAEGHYEFSIGEYSYNLKGAAQTTVAVSGATLYIDGKMISDATESEGAEKTLSGEGYTVVRDAANKFTVTLDGAHVKGLYTTNGASLTIVLKSDSSIDTSMNAEYTHWIGWDGGGMTVTEQDYGALIARCPLTVKTDADVTAKLTVNGRISAIDATVTIEDGASVEATVASANKFDGVTCASLDVQAGGALSVKYTGAEINSQFGGGAAEKFAVNATTALNVAGTLDVEWSGQAVTSPAITVTDGGAMTVKRVGAELSGTCGIVTAGSPVFSGNVTVKGFDNGIFLNDEDASQTLTVSGGKLDITAVTYGINTRNVDDGTYYICRELYFNGGVTNIKVGEKGVAAITTANVTVGAGEVNLDAKHGVGIESRAISEWWDGVGYVVRTTRLRVKTVGGDCKVGKLSISSRDGNAALAVTEFNLNGGQVYLYACANAGSVLHAQADAEITVANADLTIENGTPLDVAHGSFGRGINAESGNVSVVVANSGKLIFKNVQVAIESWSKPSTLDNNGLIILDGYILGLEQWQVNSWQLQITVTNNGQIRQYNQVKAD